VALLFDLRPWDSHHVWTVLGYTFGESSSRR